MDNKLRISTILIKSLCIVLTFIVSGLFISGCKSSDASYNPKNTSSTPNTTTPDTTNAVTTASTLIWDAPTTYTDGSQLLALKEYRLYFSTSSGSYSTGSYYSVPPQTTSVKAKDVISQGTGTYYFVVTAVDSSNSESYPSDEVSKYLR